MVPLPPLASTCPFSSRLKTPGSPAGAVTFRSWRIAVQRVDALDAVTVRPARVQVSVAALPNGVWKAPIQRPGSNSFGWPRSAGAGANPFAAPIGT